MFVMTNYKWILICCLWFSFFMEPSSTAKILGLFAHPSESHFAVMRSIVLELSRRQNNVTLYSFHGLGESMDNVREHVIKPEFDFWKKLQTQALNKENSLIDLSQLEAADLQRSLGLTGAAAVDQFLGNKKLQNLLQLNGYEFDYDLIIVDLFYTEALLAFGYYYNTPTIGLLSSNFENYMLHTIDAMVPVACSPIDFELYDSEADFWGRLGNIRNCVASRNAFVKNNMANQEKIIRKYFGQRDAVVPSIPQLQSQLGVLLVNNHVPLMTPRPLLPNIIPAGGLHIKAARELPRKLREFIDEARVGVIYINLGNELLCGSIPSNVLQAFYKVLGKYKERVVWTCHDVRTLPDMPKNMLVQHMAPQTDILAHPHVKAFIMNGDLISLIDGIVRHVPLIGIPIFRNEIQNMALAERLGVAVKIDYGNFSSDSLTWALQQVLYQEYYPLTIREVATSFRDRPLGALETAMYWINYVVKHSGGAFIKTKGVGIESCQLHLFDLFIFYFLIGTIAVLVLVGLYLMGTMLWDNQNFKKVSNKTN